MDISHGHRPTTLVRFPRNRVKLTRSASGRLALETPRRRAGIRVRTNRRVHARLTLDPRMGRITIEVAERRISIKLALKAESRVILARSVRNVSVKPLESAPARTGPAKQATLTPTPTPTPTTTTTTTTWSASPSLFSSDSVWRKPLADDAAVDPASAALVSALRGTVARTDAWIGSGGTSTFYVVPADQPTVRVQLDSGSWGATLQQAFQAVPIPPNAVPALGNDAQMTIYQPSTDRLWEFFRARKLDDGWHASWGGAMTRASRSPGYYDTDSWPGLSGTHWGATATSLPIIGGTIMAHELRAGVIPHALALNIPWAKAKTYTWPAQRTDGKSTEPDAIPEGARFRLDPTLDLDTLNLPPVTRMIARAAQRYGMIVRDQTGQSVGLFAENWTQHGTNPYSGPTGLYGGTPSNVLLRAFPWDRLQVLKMHLRTGD
jgi:hypothetical protein